MIDLRGTTSLDARSRTFHQGLWRLTRDQIPAASSDAYLITDNQNLPQGFDLYVVPADATVPDATGGDVSILRLPIELSYLSHDDVIVTNESGTKTGVLWRSSSPHNAILLTERCDNYCLMCSQPPKTGIDDWLIERAFQLLDLIPNSASALTYTGGEPTLCGNQFLELLSKTKTNLPECHVQILSNGRSFADSDFAVGYATINNPNHLMAIPIYGAEPSLHDFVVQAPGAFDETIRGILNLSALGQKIELRVVIHKQTAPSLVAIASFISRNLPFVDHVALMGLEVMGLARANLADVWIDPYDYKAELTEATFLLRAAGIDVRIYNHPLCLTEVDVWDFAVRSISDWKNTYLSQCQECSVRDQCGGLFKSSSYKVSDRISPL